ncbi:MAG TPA: hypothetical protein VFU02_10495, partial [Polyangiaceae bacterium]|nr:hypothetical protein [Polyangiaceae bacterium]
IGGLPQFLTRLELAPDTFLDTHRERMQRVRQALAKLFPSTVNRMPGVLFRVGECAETPAGRSLRLPAENLVRRADKEQL